LRVDGIIEGSVHRAGDRVRITAQLIDAAEDRHLWAKSYERELREVLTLQREVAMDIASEIRLELSPQEHARMGAATRPVDPRANDLYLRGRFLWSKFRPEEVARSIDLFAQAIAIDPDDARYYSGLADAYLVAAKFVQSIPAAEAVPKVKEAAAKSLALDENSADAHCSMGAALFFADWDWEGAERHLRRALELNPNHAIALLVYASMLEASGDLAGAIAHTTHAREIDPLSLLINFNLGSMLLEAGRLDEALAQAQRTLEIDPNSPLPQTLIVLVHQEAGDFEAAIDGFEKWLPEEGHKARFISELRTAYRSGGAKAYWRKQLELTLAEGAAANANAILPLAQLYARVGEVDEALALIDRAITERTSDALFVASAPAFKPLRDDPRFVEQLRRIGVRPRSS
jgi:adenylate cyclase